MLSHALAKPDWEIRFLQHRHCKGKKSDEEEQIDLKKKK
jgi:hypothetical protein